MRKLIFLFVISLYGCDLQRKLINTDKSKRTTITEEKKIIRKGDSISLIIPNIRYKDTTITRYNYETKTKVRVVYDKQGNQKIDCVSAEIKEEFKKIREDLKNDIKGQNEIQNEFKPQHLFYAIAVLIAVFVIAMFSFYYLFSKSQKQFLQILNK